MDRKAEFARLVDAVQAADQERNGVARNAAGALLHDAVRELRNRISSGDTAAVDEALDFLEIRRPVYGVGYEQEKLLRTLKKAPLDGTQVGRLEFLAGQLIESSLQGGQLRELAKALRDHATAHFQERLSQLGGSGNPTVARRAKRMLDVLAQGSPTEEV